jgi:gliding motility-associated-like protein
VLYIRYFLYLFVFMIQINNAVGSSLIADIQDTISYTGKPVICPGGQLMLTGANAPANSTFKWYKDKQTSPVATTPAYTVTTAGSYTLSIVSNGVSYTYPALIVTNSPLPVANFILVNNPECASEPITFKNQSTGDGLKYVWNFGDPASPLNRSYETNPVHQFVGKPGDGSQTFTISLTVTNKGGCVQAVTKSITLKQSPGVELGGMGKTIYDGKDYFVVCENVPTVFTFTNISSTKSTNESYNLYWGDGSGQINLKEFTTATHRYRPGLYVLFYTVTGKNGCSLVKKYRIFVGESPKVSFASAAPVNTCIGTPVTWSLSNLSNNTKGTLYTATYSDGTVVDYDLPPDTLMHTFLSNSVNNTSSYEDKTYNNAFLVKLVASNPCGSATAVSEPIYVSDPPKAVINSIPSAICLNTLVNVKSVGALGYSVSADGYRFNKLLWKITPASGFEASSNDLGSGQADGDVKNWISGTENLNIRFTKAGNYNITLIAGSELCGIDSTSVQICVTDLPVALFDVDAAEGCSPLIVKTTNKSNKPFCNINSYKWRVSYKPDACNNNTTEYVFLDGTSSVSENPVFKFTKSGTYTISLVNSYPVQNCTSVTFSKEIIIKQKPIVYLKAPDVIYKDQSFKPTIVATNCSPADQLSFAWEYSGGSAIFSQGELDSVKYNNIGRYNLSVKITSSCGFTEATVEIEVIARPTFFIPNTFTPNNDGVNDTWSIRGLDSNPRNTLKIFNRTGSLLYEAKTNLTPWDGQFMGKRLPAGVYYYTLYSGVAKQAFSGWISMIY